MARQIPPRPRPALADGAAEPRLDAGTIKTKSGVDLTEKVRELLLLAKEQGHLTYDDINDALPDSIVTPEDLDQIYTKLANLEIEIVDPAEVDRVKQPEVGGGGGKGAAGHSGRPGADVSAADGQGAVADARAGGGDLQAD